MVISGGRHSANSTILSTVHRIKWLVDNGPDQDGKLALAIEKMPNLNVARRDHASCALGSSIFVFCGKSSASCRQSLNTIERLNLTSSNSSRRSQSYWQLIRQNQANLAPRYQPAVAQISQYEVAILGGWSNQAHKRLGDVVYFDTRSHACVRRFEGRQNGAGEDCNNYNDDDVERSDVKF